MRSRTARQLLFLIAASSLALFPARSSGAQSYGDLLGKALINATIAASERGDWRPVAYPTDNFGVGTLYDGKGAGSFLCATASCLSMPDGTTKTLKDQGFIETGTGGTISLTDEQKRSLSFGAILPEIFAVLGLTGKFDSSKVVTTDLKIGSATIRRLIRGKLTDRITQKPPSAAVSDANANRRLRAVVADLVVDSLEATVSLDATTSAEVKAKLDETVGKVVGKDASFEFGLTRGADGKYVIKVSNPVIAAVALRKQPRSGPLGAATDRMDWSRWPVDAALKIRTDSGQD